MSITKKKLGALVLILIFALTTVLIGACAKNGGSDPSPSPSTSPPPSPVVPAFTDFTADVSERPEGLSTGTWTLEKVEIDDEELSDYVTRNEQFLFGFDFYGVLGEGQHDIKLTFTEGIKTFKITVTDALTPKYEYALDSEIVFDLEQDISFPVVQRENAYQAYDVEYKLTLAGETIFSGENLEKEAEELVLDGGLDAGEYTLTVKIIKGGQAVEEFVSLVVVDDASVLPVRNIFKQAANADWHPVHTFVASSYDSAEQAAKFTIASSGSGLNQRYFAVYYPADVLKAALDAGRKGFSFDIKGTVQGVRLFGQSTNTLAGDAIVDATSGVYEWYDIAGEISDEEYVTVSVDLTVLYNKGGEDINYIGMTFLGSLGSEVWFKNARIMAEAEYDDFLTGWLSSKDYAASTANWTVMANLNMGWDSAQSAIKVTVNDGDLRPAALGSQYRTFYTSTADIKAIYDTFKDSGVRYLKFSYKADEAFLTGASALKLTGNNGADGVSAWTARYGVFHVTEADTWVTEYISLDVFFGMEVSSKLCFVMAGPENSAVLFKDIGFATQSEFAAYLEAKEFTEGDVRNAIRHTDTGGGDVQGSDWHANWLVPMTYDSTEGAAKVTAQDVTLNSRHGVVYFNANAIKAAHAAGLTTLSFDVKVSAGFIGENRGIRIFGKKNAGLDMVGIVEGSAGVYLYDDITTELVEGEYITVTIDIEEFLALNDGEDINFLGMVFAGTNGSVAYFKNVAYS